MNVFLSFPAHVNCADRFCPLNDYGRHSHTYYNVYGIPALFYSEGMPEIDAAEFATVVRPLEIVPFHSAKNEVTNV